MTENFSLLIRLQRHLDVPLELVVHGNLPPHLCLDLIENVGKEVGKHDSI